VHGDLAYPTVTTDRFLRDGDIIWVDAGITWQGYASDYGRTWITGRAATPNAKQQGQFHRWRAVVDAALDILKPGVSALQLGTAAIEANGGVRPWIDHFYLAHGIGVDSAEMPLIGTDLGDHFDERLIMQPGMVAVFEPVIWDDGAAGYRSEDIVAVTDTGWVKLSGSTYEPFGVMP
jgi:Xaa-Pro dipeptidase